MTRRGLSFRVTGASSPHDKAVTGSAIMHAEYSKGNETSAQIAAQEANLQLANAARLSYTGVTNISVTLTRAQRVHRTGIKLPKTDYYKTALQRGQDYGLRFQDGAYLASLRTLPRGDQVIAYAAIRAPRAATITGNFQKFIKEIGPSRQPGFTKVVKPQSQQLAHQKNWTHRGHIWVPK